MQPVGLYAWGGPGTIRLLNVKYHNPRVDETSFLTLYDAAFLEQAQQKLGVTDMWVTYSWGFSDQTEQEDRQFIVDRLPNFKEQEIRTHAYVQGLNVVTSEFLDADIFCKDGRGRLLPYSKGRALTCPNNPAARQIIRDRVQAACNEDFSGVFVDNILFGLPPFFIRRDYTSFFGCSCEHCQRAFKEQFGYGLPLDKVVGEIQVTDYLAFRRQSVYNLVKELSELAHSHGKQFGINLYDPYWYSPEFYFGYRVADIMPLLDYYLIENHALGRVDGIDNRHLTPLLESDKPTFVISYRKGIGYDGAYGQREIDLIWSEAEALGYAPCLKATEYITHGKWHALDLSCIDAPAITESPLRKDSHPRHILKASNRIERQFIRIASPYYASLAQLIFENKPLATWISRSGIMVGAFRKNRHFQWGS